MSNVMTDSAAKPVTDNRRRVLMTLGGGGQLYASSRIAKTLDPRFNLHFVTAPESSAGVDPAYRSRTSYNPSLVLKTRPSRFRTCWMTLVAIVHAFGIISRFRPHGIIGVQGASALPLMIVGTLFGAKRVYIETITRQRRSAQSQCGQTAQWLDQRRHSSFICCNRRKNLRQALATVGPY